MKKMISLLAVMVLTLAGCGATTATDSDKIQVVTTVYPIYDMVYQIGGENVEVTNVYPNGADIHEYELTSKDMAMVAESDLFFYVTEDATPFVHDLEASGDYTTKFVDVTLDPYYLENSTHAHEGHDHAEGEEHVEGHDHAEGEEHVEGEEHEHSDAHIWLSAKENMIVAQVVANELSAIDPENEAFYQANAQVIIDELKVLDEEYTTLGQEQTKTAYVAHDAYSFINEDYGTDIVGIYGAHHDDEPSAQEIATIIEDMNADGSKYIYVEQDDLDNKIVMQIASEVGAEVLVLNNMETVSQETMDNHVSFVDLMEQNLESLSKLND